MARVTKSFSVDDELDKDVIEKLDSVGNRSEYLKELIRNDLKSLGSEVFNIEERETIKKIVLNILDNYDLQDKETKEIIVDKDEKLKAMDSWE